MGIHLGPRSPVRPSPRIERDLMMPLQAEIPRFLGSARPKKTIVDWLLVPWLCGLSTRLFKRSGRYKLSCEDPNTTANYLFNCCSTGAGPNCWQPWVPGKEKWLFFVKMLVHYNTCKNLMQTGRPKKLAIEMIEKELAPSRIRRRGLNARQWKDTTRWFSFIIDIRIASSTLCWIHIRELAHGHKKFASAIWNSIRVNTNSIS